MSLTKVHSRMIDGAPIRVEDFGAVGDGVTDDSAAFQAAIDFEGGFGGVIELRPRTNYAIANTLRIIDAVTIAGSDRKGRRSAASQSGLIWTGNDDHMIQIVTSASDVYDSGVVGHVNATQGISDVNIEGINFQNKGTLESFIYADNTFSTTIKRCRVQLLDTNISGAFFDTPDNGPAGTYNMYVTIDDCYLIGKCNNQNGAVPYAIRIFNGGEHVIRRCFIQNFQYNVEMGGARGQTECSIVDTQIQQGGSSAPAQLKAPTTTSCLVLRGSVTGMTIRGCGFTVGYQGDFDDGTTSVASDSDNCHALLIRSTAADSASTTSVMGFVDFIGCHFNANGVCNNGIIDELSGVQRSTGDQRVMISQSIFQRLSTFPIASGPHSINYRMKDCASTQATDFLTYEVTDEISASGEFRFWVLGNNNRIKIANTSATTIDSYDPETVIRGEQINVSFSDANSTVTFANTGSYSLRSNQVFVNGTAAVNFNWSPTSGENLIMYYHDHMDCIPLNTQT